MGDISIPHALNQASLALSFVDSLSKLLDPSERKKISDDIKNHHALNESEFKKSEEARLLIKKHQEILDETKKVSEKNEQEKKGLEQEKMRFKSECEAESLSLFKKRSDADLSKENAEKLCKEAEEIQMKTNEKERQLNKDKEEHNKNVKQYIEDKRDLEKLRKETDKYKNEVVALDKETKNRIAKLKEFNF